MATCTPEKVNKTIDEVVMRKVAYGASFNVEKAFQAAEKAVDYYDDEIRNICEGKEKFDNKIYSAIMKSAWISWKFACKYPSNLDLYPSFAETLHQKWEIAKEVMTWKK